MGSGRCCFARGPRGFLPQELMKASLVREPPQVAAGDTRHALQPGADRAGRGHPHPPGPRTRFPALPPSLPPGPYPISVPRAPPAPCSPGVPPEALRGPPGREGARFFTSAEGKPGPEPLPAPAGSFCKLETGDPVTEPKAGSRGSYGRRARCPFRGHLWGIRLGSPEHRCPRPRGLTVTRRPTVGVALSFTESFPTRDLVGGERAGPAPRGT